MSDYIQSEQAGLWVTLKRCRYTRKGILRNDLRMPIAPLDEFGWDATYGWTDYDTISEGQYTRPSGRQLRTFSISTLALDYIAPWAITQQKDRPDPTSADPALRALAKLNAGGDLTDEEWRLVTSLASREDLIDESAWGNVQEIGPWGIARQLDRLVTQGSPIRVVVRNPALPQADINMITTLRSANLRERAGEPDARYFELSFTEYRAPKIARRNYGEHQLPAQVQINSEGVALEFKRGDEKLKRKEWHKIGTERRPATLRDLSKHFYGTSNKWRLIQKRNRGLLQGFSGNDSLKEVFDKRKRKKKPLRLSIPEASWEPGKGAKQAKTGGGVLPY